MEKGEPLGVLLFGFSERDRERIASAVASAGREPIFGDPSRDAAVPLVLAASYDRDALRDRRASAYDDRRPWCFCVPAADRGLVAASSAAREGWTLLLPAEDRETRRTLSAMSEAARERSNFAASSGLERVEASFSWRTADLEVGDAGRRIARLLADTGFAPGRAAEDACALALEEALLNAVEHGNLGLDSSLKPDDPRSEDLFAAERARRLADPAFGGLLVRLSLVAGDGLARLVVEDEGDGFDSSSIGSAPIDAGVAGKGYWLIRRFFDGAEYSEKGNALTLTKLKPGRA